MVRVVGEDTDTETYELGDGEETPVVGKDGDEYPACQTYVLKDGPGIPRIFAPVMPPNEPSTAAELVTKIEGDLAAINERSEVEEPVQEVQSYIADQVSDSHPIPESFDEDDRESAPPPSYPPTRKPQARPNYE
jgi:hypothetical protein